MLTCKEQSQCLGHIKNVFINGGPVQKVHLRGLSTIYKNEIQLSKNTQQHIVHMLLTG